MSVFEFLLTCCIVVQLSSLLFVESNQCCRVCHCLLNEFLFLPEASSIKPFDFKSCRSKLEDHYQKTATVPTSVWSKKAVVDIHQIYTRLSWVKEKRTPAGTTQSELKHYSDLFSANNNGVIPKRILVQGQTGIGKSTFVKKLLVDWIEVNEGNGDEQAAVLKNFELVVAVNLKEVSKCQSLVDVIRKSNVFAKEDKYMTEGLVDYISNNQEKVLLIFDGYDEYRMGCNSEIYEIFHGNSLRSCCALITTRISKADELRGSEDLHAEITGFSEVDRKTFMRRFLNSKDVSELENHLDEKDLDQLAKVPLLLLFFCILWKKGKSKSFPKSKTKLYVDIVQFILNHSHSKQTADKTRTKQYVELKSFKEILSEIGKVALQSLLKDDHLFEYSQLSDSVCCDESIFIGLLQITEYSETLRPVGLVSFIHKSIQEFLAAWYVTYRCIPEGGNLGEIGVKLEECLALENVFQFICGLTKDGPSTVSRHLKSVRIADPSLDLSKAIPDVENETDEPLSDVNERQEKFRDLVLFSFAEVESKAELSSSCLDSLGNILLVSDSFPNYLLEKAIDTNSWSLVLNGGSGNLKISFSIPRLTEVAKIVVTKSSESSTFPKVAAFLQKFIDISRDYDMRGQCTCGFFSILCFRNGQVYFYITDFVLSCDSHTRLFTDAVVPSHSEHSSSGQLCLKFLKTIECYKTRRSMESLGVVIKRCNHLERIVCNFRFDSDYSHAHDSFCHLLEQVQHPDRCSLSIEFCALTSTGAARLAYLLPRFGNVTCLCLSLAECSTGAVRRLVAAIKHKTLEKLELDGLDLESFRALGQSLPELSALQTLSIGASVGCILQLVFPVGSESLPRLKVRGLTESSAEAVTRLIDLFRHRTFEELKLENIHLTSAVAEVLGQLRPELSALRTLRIRRLTVCTDEAVTRLIDVVNHKTLEKLELSEIYLTSAVAESLGQSLPELSALQTLEISGFDECSLHLRFSVFSDDLHVTIRGLTECSAEVVTGIVAGIKHKTLEKLEVSEIKLASAVTNLLTTITIKHKTLTVLELRNVCLTSAAAKALCQSLPQLSALRTLKISGLNTSSAETLTKQLAAIQHKSLEELILSRIHLTLAAAEALGQSLPELSALQTLEISGWEGCNLRQKECRLQHEDMEALFSKFNRPSSLKELRITNFKARGSLAQPIQNLSFFPCLEKLQLINLNIGEADLNGLLKNLEFMPDLRVLHLWGNSLGPGIRLMVPYLLEHQNLQSVVFPQMYSTKDLDYVQNAVNEKRPQLRIEKW